MPRLSPKPETELGELEPMLEMISQAIGFIPQSLLTMAHWPEMTQAIGGVATVILGSGELDPELKQLLSLVASQAAGCRYCQAHTSQGAKQCGVPEEKIRATCEFESSPLFSDAERAALRIAARAAAVPNAVEDKDIEVLKQYYSEREIVEIVAVIAIFGFFNRWNDTLATRLEAGPRSFAEEALGPLGWTLDKHA